MIRLLSLLALASATAVAAGQGPTEFTIIGGKHDVTNVVVAIPLSEKAEITRLNLPDGGKQRPAQVVSTGLLADGKTKYALMTVLPKVAAGETVVLSVPKAIQLYKESKFKFVEEEGKHVDLLVNDRKVLRYMNAKRDGTTKDTHELTFKPFHHVYDPIKGETLLTNGAGLAADKNLQFPHHRGIYLGWMTIRYGANQTADVWHGRNGEYTQHEKMLLSEAGSVVARQRAAINWHGKDGLLFAEETREVDVFMQPKGTLLEFSSILTTKLPRVTLDGDPQHAGFHFRAAMETAKKYAKETYYLRPDGKDAPGKTRNWDPKTKQGPVNLPWNAMSFKVADTRYTAVYLDHPDNPKEARYSERDYGRFGSYFVFDVTPTTPLRIKYRIYITEGEMTKDEVENLSHGFVDAPKVK